MKQSAASEGVYDPGLVALLETLPKDVETTPIKQPKKAVESTPQKGTPGKGTPAPAKSTPVKPKGKKKKKGKKGKKEKKGKKDADDGSDDTESDDEWPSDASTDVAE